mgnify:CR=1 FL=1
MTKEARRVRAGQEKTVSTGNIAHSGPGRQVKSVFDLSGHVAREPAPRPAMTVEQAELILAALAKVREERQ